MGRRPKPTSLLKLEGAYQPAWHGDRSNEPQPGGVPAMPGGLPEDAVEFWRRNVPLLVETGVATQADQDALVRLSLLWAECCTLLRMEQRPTGWLYQYLAADKAWFAAAGRFGMTPSDRTRVAVQRRQELDPAAEFVA